MRLKYADRLAGIYREENEPDIVVVRLNGHAPVADAIYPLKEGVFRIHFVVGAAHTQVELQDILDQQRDDLVRILPNIQGTYVDVKTGEIGLDVFAKHGPDPVTKAEIQRLLKVPVRIRLLSAPPRQQGAHGTGSVHDPSGKTSD